MKFIFQLFLTVFLALMNGVSVRSAEIYYDSDVKLYVRGGIKPGPLVKENFWVSITPRAINHNIGMIVYLFAKNKTTNSTSRFAAISCNVGNSTTVPTNLTLTYWGKSCNLAALPSGSATESVQVPDNAIITASTNTIYETSTNLRNIVTPIRTFYVQERKNWKSCNEAKAEPNDPVPITGRKSLGVHVYSIPDTEGGVVGEKKLCVVITSHGAIVQNRAYSGAIFKKTHGRQIYLGSFICDYGENNRDIDDGSTDYIAECTNEHPSSDPKSENSGLKVDGKLEVKLTFSFGMKSVNPDKVFEKNNQPILAYPPR